MIFREGELNPHEQRENSREPEEHEGSHDIANANVFVVRTAKPAEQSRRSTPYCFQREVCLFVWRDQGGNRSTRNFHVDLAQRSSEFGGITNALISKSPDNRAAH